MEHFKDSEFKCCDECGKGRGDIRIESLVKLEDAREIAGVPFILNSSIRCKKHNAEVGGREFSSHITGAFDIACTNSQQRFKIVRGLIIAGFTRIGIAKTFIHADDEVTKPAGVIWLYK